MVFVEPVTISGVLYKYEGFDRLVLLSEYGSFSFEENEDGEIEFSGRIQPFQMKGLSGNRDVVYENVEVEAFMTSEMLFVPVSGDVTAFQEQVSYVLEGERVVTIGHTRTLFEDGKGVQLGSGRDDRVVEVYSGALAEPRSVVADNNHSPGLVLESDLEEEFEEREVRMVLVV